MPTEWKENDEFFFFPPLTGQYINKTVLVDLFSSFQKKKKRIVTLSFIHHPKNVLKTGEARGIFSSSFGQQGPNR